MITQTRIMEWYQHYQGNVCVSFSGGKDSTVLLHIARQLYPDIPAVFSDTGLEYSAIREFVKTWDNVDIIRPDMNFGQVITTYGYPIIGKEVAEAIYYARRIRPSGEREREREREDGQQSSIIAESSWGSGQPHRDKRSEKQKNDSARSMGREVDWKRLEIGGAEHARNAEETERPQREMAEGLRKSRGSGKWKDYHRRCLNPDESNPEDKDRFWNKPAKTEWSDWRRGCL